MDRTATTRVAVIRTILTDQLFGLGGWNCVVFGLDVQMNAEAFILEHNA